MRQDINAKLVFLLAEEADSRAEVVPGDCPEPLWQRRTSMREARQESRSSTAQAR